MTANDVRDRPKDQAERVAITVIGVLFIAFGLTIWLRFLSLVLFSKF